jgi:hypothetical protein
MTAVPKASTCRSDVVLMAQDEVLAAGPHVACFPPPCSIDPHMQGLQQGRGGTRGVQCSWLWSKGACLASIVPPHPPAPATPRPPGPCPPQGGRRLPAAAPWPGCGCVPPELRHDSAQLARSGVPSALS